MPGDQGPCANDARKPAPPIIVRRDADPNHDQASAGIGVWWLRDRVATAPGSLS